MTYTASFKLDGQIIVRNFKGYSSKKFLAEEIRRNGGRVRVIATPENFDEAVQKYGKANERHAAIQKYVREQRKKS